MTSDLVISLTTVPFAKNWKKLRGRKIGEEFHTVRWGDKFDQFDRKKGNKVTIAVKKKDKYICMVSDVIKAKIGELTDEFIAADTSPDYSRIRFYRMMQAWYHRKPDWKGWDSEVCIIFLMVYEYIKKGKCCGDCVRFPCASSPVIKDGKVVGREQMVFKDDKLCNCNGEDFIPK